MLALLWFDELFIWQHYLVDEVPPERQIGYSPGKIREHEVHAARTSRFVNTYFYNTLYEWNLLEGAIENSVSLSQLKIKLLKIIRPQKKSTCDTAGVK